jgi:hypothetical protein
MMRIDADILALEVSRQRKYQMQWQREGRCTQCGHAREHFKQHCDECQVRQREARRVEFGCVRRNFGARSYQVEAGA